MAFRMVMSVDMNCSKCKEEAWQSVTKIDGLDTVSINQKERTITVDGDADPVCIVNKIRRKFKCARLVSYGPRPPPPKPEPKEKKDDGKKDGKKEDGKKDDGKKAEEKKDDVKSQIIICPGYWPSVEYCSCVPPQHCGCSNKSGMMAWHGYHPPQPPANEVWYISSEENPGYCTIC